ncbi:MAG: M48 family metallopeptidase [Devosia sp.]
MAFLGRFYDGRLAAARAVELHYLAEYETGTLLVNAADDHGELARWPAGDLYEIPGRKDELLLAALGQANARVVVRGADHIARIRATLPVLQARQRLAFRHQLRLAITATLALAVVIAAYLYGVPLLAGRLVGLVPIAWEQRLGASLADQMQSSLGGLPLCDPDPQSVANRALTRFGAAALAGSGSPFTLDISVARSEVPNAFALPGGQVFFLSALLDQAQSPDEFAGVLAHEVGHVARRHGMEQLISSAGTGVLIGFILGDMTGISLAAGLSATIVDARFSREAERQADVFATQTGQRLGFDAARLADLLNRVGSDDDLARALALLSDHPLTNDRKAALERLSRPLPAGAQPVFSDAEWRAIKSMCGAPPGQRGTPINLGAEQAK